MCYGLSVVDCVSLVVGCLLFVFRLLFVGHCMLLLFIRCCFVFVGRKCCLMSMLCLLFLVSLFMHLVSCLWFVCCVLCDV